MKKDIDNLIKYLNANGFKKEAEYINKIAFFSSIKDKAYEFSDYAGQKISDFSEEYIEPLIFEKEEVDQTSKESDQSQDAAPDLKESYSEPKPDRRDREYKSWSRPNVPGSKGGRPNFWRVVGNNNYRSAKPPNSRSFFQYLKEKHNITTVVDLMGSSEGESVRGAGLEYVSIPLGDKGPSDRNWVRIRDILNRGNALVHCRHGADRTGAIIARYEIERGKDPNKAYEDALKYGFKSEKFQGYFPKGSSKYNPDPNRHLRKYIFDSERYDGYTEDSSKEEVYAPDKSGGIFENVTSIVDSGVNKIKEFIGMKDDKEASEPIDSKPSPVNISELDGADYSSVYIGKKAVSPQEIYDFMTIELGISHNHAMGALGNVSRESSFKPWVIGDSGTSGGFFQMHKSRFRAMEDECPDWRTNWKCQVVHAMKTDRAPEYLRKEFDTPEEAAKWFETKYERPNRKHYKSHSWYANRFRKMNIVPNRMDFNDFEDDLSIIT